MLSELQKIKYKRESLQQTFDNNLRKIDELGSQLNETNQELGFILESREYYRKAIDIIYERSVEELKNILNSALHYVFYDEDYLLDIVLTDKRGKSLNMTLYKGGRPVNLKRGTGMGVKTVISAVLQMYYLNCKNSRVLMLDEKYSAVSVEYTDRFFEFLSQMCEKLDFTIIMITHDERFLRVGDKHYVINRGKVRLKPVNSETI